MSADRTADLPPGRLAAPFVAEVVAAWLSWPVPF
jgi:hypothetical protein